AALAAAPEPEVHFGYLGRIGTAAAGAAGARLTELPLTEIVAHDDPSRPERYRSGGGDGEGLSVGAAIENGALRVRLRFGPTFARTAEARSFGRRYLDAVRELIGQGSEDQ